ncbi:MAG: hypothetical protein H8E31_14105 [Planctomycetes bacterium]|nr:hypothetical protein [Planctomycetota bacterium]
MKITRPTLSLLCLLLVLPACGNKLIRPFKKKPGQGQEQERPERPAPPEPSPAGNSGSEPVDPPVEPPPSAPPSQPPPAGGYEPGPAAGGPELAAMGVPPSSRLPDARSGGEWYEWTASTLAYTEGATDLSQIFRTGAAGKHGFLKVKGEDFVFADGTPFRIWGTNLARGAPAPTKEEAPKIAAQLARLGYNAVRLHLIDSVQLLFNNQTTVTRLNPEMLDRMDFLIAELKKRGIYFDINLYVWRRYGNDDPVPTPREIPDKGRFVNYFHPDVWKIEKEYTRQLLSHKNPYTGLSYAEDPAMCFVELSNENSIFGGWASGLLDEGAPAKKGISKPYRDWLDQDFNRWLKTRYSSTSALRAAWDKGAGKGREGLGSQESLERGTVLRTPGKDLKRYSPARVTDTAHYFYYLEKHYVDDYRDFLRKELKVKVPVLNTQNYSSLPGLAAQAEADWVDTHTYWDHPQFKDAKRSQPLMKVHLKSLVQNPIIPHTTGPGSRLSMFTETTLSRVVGKPSTITEWAPSKANPFAWEVPQIFGAYTAFQDLDGLFSFAYAQGREDYSPGPMSNHLQWSNVTPFLLVNAVAGLAWRRGDIAPAKERIELHYTEEDIFDGRNAAGVGVYWWGKDVPSTVPLQVPVARVLRSSGKDTGPLHLLKEKDTKLYRSSTGELTWDVRDPQDAHVLIDSPRYQGVVGSLQRPAAAKNFSVSGDGRAAVSVISLDNQPLARTKRALLSAVSDFRFKGEKIDRSGEFQVWNQGRLPLEVRAVRATVTLAGWSQASKLVCYALDPKGGRAARVPVQASGGQAVIDLKAYPYACFELVAE